MNAIAPTTQAVCILGCMKQAVPFNAHALCHARMDVYVTNPTAGPELPWTPLLADLRVIAASPNPLRDAMLVSFRAFKGVRATLRVVDVRGALVSRIWGAPPRPARCSMCPGTRLPVPGGVYFVVMESGARHNGEGRGCVDVQEDLNRDGAP